jgi:hypothetical protein
MNKSAELLLAQFHSHRLFPQLLSDLVATADAIFSSPISEITKGKADKVLHTSKIGNTEVLSDMDKLSCDVFEYLASVVNSAGKCPNVDFNQIQLDSITIIFKYVEHYYPNAVRASAGTIVSSLSVSPKHATMVCDMFWKRFASLKKDDEFRNFATIIDGIQNVQLSLDDPQLAQTSLQFLSNFVSGSKKIERGVLRMKFLAVLLEILSPLCKSPAAPSNTGLQSPMASIWDRVLELTQKAKVTGFCLDFLGKMTVSTLLSFFVGHAAAPSIFCTKPQPKQRKATRLISNRSHMRSSASRRTTLTARIPSSARMSSVGYCLFCFGQPRRSRNLV